MNLEFYTKLLYLVNPYGAPTDHANVAVPRKIHTGHMTATHIQIFGA